MLDDLAWAYSKVGDKRALATAKQAYVAGPMIAGVQDTYGWILLKSKTNPKQALGVLQRAASAPNDAEIRYHLGVA